MTREQFIIFLMSNQGMTLVEAEAAADIQFAEPTPAIVTQQAETKKVLSAEAQKAAEIENGWDDQIDEHEREAQNAVYSGQIRRIKRIVQEKMRMRKFFERSKMYM